MLIRCAAWAVLSLLPSTAVAHPGHGRSSDGEASMLWHYLTEPVHLAMAVPAVLAIIAIAAWFLLRQAASNTADPE